MEIVFEKNKVGAKLVIKKDELKAQIMDLKTSYKKYMNVFFEKHYNTTFGLMTLMSYFLILKTRLYQDNPNIENELIITHDNENFYVRINVLVFYDRDFRNYTTEQLEFLVNTKLSEDEKDVLTNYINLVPDEKFIKENFYIFIDLMFKADDLIKTLKEKLKNKEIDSRKMEFELMKRLFSSFALTVIKDEAKNDKDFLEEYYGNQKEN